MADSGANDRFEVKVGRIRSQSGERKVRGFLRKLSKSALRAGKRSHKGRAGRPASRRQFFRRVIVKAHFVRMDAKGVKAQRLHLNYVERDGTGRDGEPSKLYDRDSLEVDKQTFLERGQDDRHQFRIIVSPEDAGELKDLTDFTRDLVDQMERDLGTRLDWIAANHYDTGQPHTHLILRGKRDDGTDLVIPRDYIANGIRNRAQELSDIELGPVSEIEGRIRMARMVQQERFTQIDRTLLHRARGGVVDLSAPSKPGRAWHTQLTRLRLKKLAEMGLAEPLGKGRWRIEQKAESTLHRMGERGDIIKSMHRAMSGKIHLRIIDAASIFDPASKTAKSVTGAIIAKGVADDVHDRAFIVVDILEGKPVYAVIGAEDRLLDFSKGQIVTLAPSNIDARASDVAIAKIAGANAGRYSALLHMDADKTARPEFVQAHIRRLEALRRAEHVRRQPDGDWVIPPDYLVRAREFEKEAAARHPIDIRLHSTSSLTAMKTAIGATWLDEHLRDFDDIENTCGFGGDVQAARIARRRFLVQQGYLKPGQQKLAQCILDALEHADVTSAGTELGARLSKTYSPTSATGRVEGVYTDVIDRPSGRYAVIERAKDFSLVPWRAVLERNRGKAISGFVQNTGISWRLTKGRGIS